MKTRGLSLKRMESAPRLSLATAAGPVFAMLDPPGVPDAHGDTMDAGALRLPQGTNEVPLYWVHSYHEGVVAKATPEQRLPIGVATVWEESGQWYFIPRFTLLTDLSQQVKDAVGAGDINACSIGYRTVRGTPNGKGPEKAGEDVHEARLLEVSLVDAGAKSGAVRVKMEPPAGNDVGAKLDALTQLVTELVGQVKQLVTPKAAEEKTEPPTPEAKDAAPPPAEKKDPPKDAPTPAAETPKEPPPAAPADEDPVTKWLRSFPK